MDSEYCGYKIINYNLGEIDLNNYKISDNCVLFRLVIEDILRRLGLFLKHDWIICRMAGLDAERIGWKLTGVCFALNLVEKMQDIIILFMSKLNYSTTTRDNNDLSRTRELGFNNELSVSQRSVSPSYQRLPMYTFSPNDRRNEN